MNTTSTNEDREVVAGTMVLSFIIKDFVKHSIECLKQSSTMIEKLESIAFSQPGLQSSGEQGTQDKRLFSEFYDIGFLSLGFSAGG